MRLTFGKFNGTDLADVPDDYLRWLAGAYGGPDWGGDVDPDLRAALDAEARRRAARQARKDSRRRSYRTQRQERTSAPEPRIPEAVDADTCRKLIAAGKRSLAMRLHPDAGGDTGAMQRVNVVADWLEQQAERALRGAGAG
jgi:hypothetical protein